MHRILAALRWFMDAILPMPPSDTDLPATEAEASQRRRRLRLRRYEKGGRGGNR